MKENAINFIKYPSAPEVDAMLGTEEPFLLLVSFDGETAVISQLDEAVEHHILLARAGLPETDIDKYFRVVFNQEGADWTFVCPVNYKGIENKGKRLTEFYKDGCREISKALSQLGYMIDITIPKRYRRHFDLMSGNLAE